jgi:hypothetical protein
LEDILILVAIVEDLQEIEEEDNFILVVEDLQEVVLGEEIKFNLKLLSSDKRLEDFLF